MRVLVVEDDADMASITQELFELKGLRTDVCGTYEEAQTATEAVHYDAFVTDVSLSGARGGLLLCEYWRERLPEAMVIVVSGDPLARSAALAKGATAFFEKPVDLGKLANLITTYTAPAAT